MLLYPVIFNSNCAYVAVKKYDGLFRIKRARIDIMTTSATNRIACVHRLTDVTRRLPSHTALMFFCLCNVWCVSRCIVVMKNDFLLLQVWPFLLYFIICVIWPSDRPSLLKVVDEDYADCCVFARCGTLPPGKTPLFWFFTPTHIT